jgi:hypothetical protein
MAKAQQGKPCILEITLIGGELVYVDQVRTIRKGACVDLISTKYGTLEVLENIAQEQVLGVADGDGVDLIMKPFQRLRWITEIPKPKKKADKLTEDI